MALLRTSFLDSPVPSPHQDISQIQILTNPRWFVLVFVATLVTTRISKLRVKFFSPYKRHGPVPPTHTYRKSAVVIKYVR